LIENRHALSGLASEATGAIAVVDAFRGYALAVVVAEFTAGAVGVRVAAADALSIDAQAPSVAIAVVDATHAYSECRVTDLGLVVARCRLRACAKAHPFATEFTAAAVGVDGAPGFDGVRLRRCIGRACIAAHCVASVVEKNWACVGRRRVVVASAAREHYDYCCAKKRKSGFQPG
jgi:hypothetical protein